MDALVGLCPGRWNAEPLAKHECTLHGGAVAEPAADEIDRSSATKEAGEFVRGRGELEAVLEPAAVTKRALAAGIDLGRELTAPEVIALAAEGNVAASALAGEVLD